MKIGEVAKKLGVTTQALRFYEAESLIIPDRSAKGTRDYTEDHLKRIMALRMLTNLGTSLADIKLLANVRARSRTGNEASRKVHAILEGIKRGLENKKLGLDRTIDDTERAKSTVEQCFECERPPNRRECENCPVSENLDHALLLYLIWDI